MIVGYPDPISNFTMGCLNKPWSHGNIKEDSKWQKPRTYATRECLLDIARMLYPKNISCLNKTQIMAIPLWTSVCMWWYMGWGGWHPCLHGQAHWQDIKILGIYNFIMTLFFKKKSKGHSHWIIYTIVVIFPSFHLLWIFFILPFLISQGGA